MILVKFKPWHVTALGHPAEQVVSEMASKVNAAIMGGPALTLLDKNESVIGCFGIVFVTSKTAEAWAMFGENARHHKLSICKSARWGIAEAGRRYSLARLQACISDDRVTARQWALYLGFTEESRMPRFGDHGETLIRYVRFY